MLLQSDKVDARIQRVIRRALLTLDFNVSTEMTSVPTVLCRKGVVQIDSLEPQKSMPRANNNVVPDKVTVVVFTDLISITSANLVAKRDPLPSCHARSDTAPHTTPTSLTRLSLCALALWRALRRATWSGLPRACTRRARRRGRGSPRERRWAIFEMCLGFGFVVIDFLVNTGTDGSVFHPC